MLTQEQKELRKSGIGGSDAAAILGYNKYKSAVDVYLTKLGLKQDDIYPDNVDLLRSDPAYWGNVNEKTVAEQYEFFENKKVVESPELLRHPKYTWMIANIDRYIPADNAVLECKTASEYQLKNWGFDEYSDEMPDAYFYQCVHYAIVCDAAYVDCAVLIGGNKFRVYRYNRDSAIEEMLIDAEHDFWHNNVLKKIVPTINKYIEASKTFKKSNGRSKEIPVELIDHIKSINFVNAKIKELQEQLDFDKAKICEFLGEEEILLSPAGMQLATWKNQVTERLDVKALKENQPAVYKEYIKSSESRILRIKEFK